ncbi:tolloid-like protein 1 [Dermacentor silvarum]|uniref:tolloid-like protein 1 n=1 Tax=Dermacentor silvarum TaxID=543639 RepID=UPI002100C60C|nr:tolloid-like protein 1 [Dermacentor silvarum]
MDSKTWGLVGVAELVLAERVPMRKNRSVDQATPQRRLAQKAPALGVPCMYEFCDQSGVFYSQGFPGPYPNQMSCTYCVIAVAPDRCWVELSFIQFNLHSNNRPDGQCGADFMEINGVRYCNRQLEGQIRILDFKGPRRSVTMHFISNDHDAGKGFLGFYKQLGCPTGEGGDGRPPTSLGGGPPELYHPKPYPHPSDSLGVATKRQQHDHPQPSCNRLYALEEFELESPGYPGPYRPGLDCRYFIRRHSDAVCALLVTFDAFDLEYSAGCHHDYLELAGHKICGQVPAGKTSVFAYFVATSGFHIAVRQNECDEPASTPGGGGVPAGDEESECDETIHKPEAMLLSANYPANYGNNLDCRYTVRKMSSSVCRLEVNFERFDVESSTDCEYDYLDVDRQRLCGIFSRNTSGMYDFEENEKQLHFHSDAANSRAAFCIRLRQVECVDEDEAESPRPPPFRPLQGGFTTSTMGVGGDGVHREHHKCDKILTNRLFDERSPNYPGGYPPNLDCKYIVLQLVPSSGASYRSYCLTCLGHNVG